MLIHLRGIVRDALQDAQRDGQFFGREAHCTANGKDEEVRGDSELDSNQRHLLAEEACFRYTIAVRGRF